MVECIIVMSRSEMVRSASVESARMRPHSQVSTVTRPGLIAGFARGGGYQATTGIALLFSRALFFTALLRC